jgi:iron complex outermembrane receptor protein
MVSRLFRIVAVLALVAPASAFAQTASVKGLVKDSSGGSIPGAVVKVVSESGGTTASEAVTDGEGLFAAASLAAGAYRVEASLDGFETAVRRVTLTAGQVLDVDLTLAPSGISEAVVVTARRSEEVAQDVPIPLSVVSGRQMAEAGAFNVNRLKEMIPTVQFYSTNPRNSSINIRGLGAPFGLTNDGIEPGVGLYIDGVFYARPASASLDFVDVERIEVLRGPQGTLFGKNTTAGAINVTTRKPAFRPESDFEVNYGNLDFLQAKASVSGPLFSQKLAGRLSFSGTQRDGTIANVRTGSHVNDLDNAGVRGSLLFVPSERVVITAAVDHTRQRPEGYTQVVAGVAPTLRAANRQWAGIASDLNYAPPSYNAFDRQTDVDSPLRSYQDLGGATFNIDLGLGSGRLTSTTSRRYWHWNPSSDRDFIGLPVTTVSAAPSNQVQWTQEVRWAGDLSRRVNLVVGGFGFHQGIDSTPTFKQEQGSAAARVLLAPTAAALTPGLLEGYGYDQYVKFRNTSAAVFGQVAWQVTDRLRLLPGLRFNYDQKTVHFDQQVYGGLQTTDPALIALQLSVLAPQKYDADVDDTNLSGQFTAAYKATSRVNAYATFSTSFKSVGLNLNGVPTDALGNPVLSAATVKPEGVKHVEVGFKTEPFRNVTANVALYNTGIDDFQTQVVNASVGVLRGYLANAEEARVRGVEFDSQARVSRNVTVYGAAAYTDARYVTFTDAPPPLEETGGPQVKDVSGSVLPGISKWATSFGAEFSHDARLAGTRGQLFAAADTSYRSDFSSSASASKYLVVNGYALVNARAGYRFNDGWSVTLWARNLFNENYYEVLTAAPGNSGLYVGQVGDQRTAGVTMRFGFKDR